MPLEFLNQFGETITMIVAFLIFCWIMKKVAWGPVTHVLEERQRRIEAGFEEIKRKQAAAEQLQRQLAARLRDIEQEERAKIQEGVAEGRRVAAEIMEKAREEAAAMSERNKRTIELEIAQARQELREEIVALTIEASRRLLRKELNEAEQRRLVGSFIDELERQSPS